MIRLAVLFHHLGPYHVARLKAAAAASPPGSSLVAVELAGRTTEYAWADVHTDGFERAIVCRDGDSNDLSRRELVASVEATLSKVAPTAIAIAGWSDRGMLATARWGLNRRMPMVIMSDSQHHDEPRVWWKEAVKRQVVGCYGAGFVAGTTHTDYLAQLGMPRDRIFTGYDVVDNDYFQAGADAARADAFRVRTELGLPNRFFLACARFIPKKNLSTLVEAFSRYQAAAGEGAYDLVLVGDGPLRGELTDQVRRLGIANAVTFAGFRQYAELPAYYGLAAAFVHPSTTDQWGLVVNEAMAAALPVVASRPSGCTRDLIQDGETGFVFDPKDTSGLTGLLSRLASDSDRSGAMGAAARRAVANWSLNRFADSLWSAASLAEPKVRSLGRSMTFKLLMRM